MLTDRSGTKWEILSSLRETEECSVDELEESTGVSPSTLNEHLSDLRAMDLIDKRSKRDGPGRPKFLYYLTEDAEHLFPHAYSKLASMLLDVIQSFSEESGARRKLVDVIKNELGEYEDLKKALRALGFYPEFKQHDEGERILFHQCPFHDVAKKDPSLCDIDRTVLTELTGKTVEMSNCIATGSDCCEFVLAEN